ncbi:MAG: hypothetical protein J6334_06455 [Kiritimatiellae bacterium]|nr:hypothetical protein [Kiritimatiellia bacterium]
MLQTIHGTVESVSPWLVGTAIGFFVFWAVLLCYETKAFVKELKWFGNLTPLYKVIVVAVFCFLTLWGGSKDRGHLPVGPTDDIASTMTQGVETVQLRTLPENVSSNGFAITDFAMDSQDKTVTFGVGWGSNLFENVDSRNVDLFMSTNLAVNGWFWLGRYLMPTGTNSYAFTVSSNDVALAYSPLYVVSYNRMAFFRFGLDFDSDGDGLTDAYETFVSSTNPSNSDTDGDGLPDAEEFLAESDPRNPDTDGDGLWDGEEQNIGTNPLLLDTDGDGLNDGIEVGQGSDPTDRADTIPVRWVLVTGDCAQGVIKQTNETVRISAGTMAFVGVFVYSEEYPYYTGQVSEYNDRVTWDIYATNNVPLSGFAHVNNEDGAWDSANENGDSAYGFFPVVLKDKAIYKASVSADLSVSVNLLAMNVSDGELPTTIFVGIFPLKVVQSNMPTATGVANTTDAATSYFRALIPTTGIAYITAEPAAPQLTAQFKDLPHWIDVMWNMTLTTERSDKRFDGIDNRILPQVTRSGSAAYDITTELLNEIVGGTCSLNIQAGNSASATYPFLIRGKNPLDVAAKEYITANVDAEFQPYAWMIVKHESKNTGNRVYNQFNAVGAEKEKPNWGTPHGWGIAQIDKGRNGDSTAEVYDWHENVVSMNAILRSKRARYNEIIGMYRNAYQNDASTQWIEPDNVTTNVNGTVMSGRQWAIMTLYNGAAGTHPLPFVGHSGEKTPIHFDPVTTNWVLYTNSNNYVPVVYGDANVTEVE